MKPAQTELVAQLKMLGFKIRYLLTHDSYVCTKNGHIFEIYTGIILYWAVANSPQKIVNYSLKDILKNMESCNDNTH